MNKKYMTFGLMGLFALALVSAMVVNNLSDTAEVEVTVDYATIVSFANINDDTFPLTRNDGWSSELNMPNITQLSTSIAGVQIINNADVSIENKILKVIVSNENDDVTCNDITNLQFLDTATPTQLAKGFQELSSLCTDDTGSVYYNISINSLDAKTTYEYPTKITFGAVNPADYNFVAQMIIA